VYHGIDLTRFQPHLQPNNDYIAYLGRIIEPKGVHLAIAAAKKANVKLKIAGKHYTGYSKDKYWQTKIKPHIDNEKIEYVGFIKNDKEKQKFLGNARALIVPSTWQEPFGIVMIEAMACGTPVIGLDNGAIPEVIKNGYTGYVVKQSTQNSQTIQRLAQAIQRIDNINRNNCRKHVEQHFSLTTMCRGYLEIYKSLLA
jgi:glycosyltransferase involved in cell wall biosynthesis